MKLSKSTERNRLSSKEPSDIAERSSISSATESVQINESTCSATSSPVDDHSSRTCSGTEQTTVIATPTITDEKGKGEITATFDENSKLHNYYLCKSSDCCTISPTDTLQSLKTKSSHSWVSTKDLSFDKTSGLWWLVYEENKGMFCLLCRKHNLKSRRSNSDVWYTTSSVQLHCEAVQDHLTTTQHRGNQAWNDAASVNISKASTRKAWSKWKRAREDLHSNLLACKRGDFKPKADPPFSNSSKNLQ